MASSPDAAACTECSKTFDGARQLDSHIRTVHKDEEECSICHAMVKDLVQHKRRVHRESSRTTKRTSRCQYCDKSFVQIVRHRCKKNVGRSPIQPIIPAPAPAVADIKSSQSSSFTVCLNDVPSPAFYPLPYSFDDRAISPLSLCSAAQLHQFSLFNPPAENDSGFRHPDDQQATPSQMLSQVRSEEMDTMSSAINQSTPFDPISVSPEIASGYPYRLESTLALPLDAISYYQDSGAVLATGATSSAAIPDHNIPIPTIEPPDADHPFAEDFNVVDSGVDALEFEDLMNWEIFGLGWSPGSI
ncbi:hypothetical protein OCU04_009959 [Sclerotinia nivalis]|uniref:C2H2-type domain-containing protein n=1 Tax=Sclerotinia nivalis TaxID=352851 RepID=A0A9X0AET8_9HELO|nr:hypothetical protein OCU04_009959 [Sclerotinia nivalis]